MVCPMVSEVNPGYVEKLDFIDRNGGNASSVEREIGSFERELEAIKQTLGDGR